MTGRERARAVWRRLVVPGSWPPRRIAGEVVLSLVLSLSAAGLEDLEGSGPARVVATALVVAVLSPLRRVLPATVLVVTGAAAGVMSGFVMLLMVAGWSAGRAVTRVGRALGAFTAAFALHTALTAYVAYTEYPEFSSLATIVFSVVFFLATTVVPGLASRYWTQRRTLLHTLQQHNAQLLRERAMVAGQARMRERQRIAQDMHDSLGHQLALIAVHTGALEVDSELTERQREGVGVLREASVAAMHELREVVGILRDGAEGTRPLEDARPVSRGVAGIEELAEASRAAGAAVELRRSGMPRALAPAADHAAYRIAQEGLTNAHKYAAGAPITVGLRYEPDSLVVEVANGPVRAGTGSGSGTAAVSGGQGLTGLKERARLIGGMVHAGPAPNGGFRLAGVLPYGPDDGSSAGAGAGAGAGAEAGAGPEAGQAGGVRPPETFVDAAGDFREQNLTGAPGDGGPVIDWTGAQREVAAAMSSSGRRVSGLALGCGVVVAIVLGLGVVAVWGLAELMQEVDRAMIDREDYEAVKAGQPEAEVRAKLPAGDSFMTSEFEGKGPPEPEGAECLTLLSSETGDSWNADPVFRFCFKGGKLIEKRSFEVGQ
ncbi:sensor histidine kinase [Streptomyces sp. KR80]|uniref:sensor histidine kinase n=1 Tax=Streptomyces sp. KR80 TaxID=3457426 RepID=UPI003FD54EBB